MQETDKRRFQRIPANISVRFLNMYSNRWRLVKTHDISQKGIGLMTDEYLSPETALEVWLPIPEKGETVYVWGNVAWSKMDEGDKYRAGIRLENADLSEVIQVLEKR